MDKTKIGNILKEKAAEFRAGSIKREWLLLLLLIFVIPIIFGMIICGYMRDKMESDKIESTLAAVRGVGQNVDNVLLWNEKFCTDMIFEERIMNFGKWTGTLNAMQKIELQKFVGEISRDIISNETISNVYIYFGKTDMVVSMTTVADSTAYYNAYFTQTFESYEQWKDIVMSSENIFFRSRTGNRLFYTKSWPQAYAEDVHIVAELDTEQLQIDFNKYNMTELGRVMFVFKDNVMYSFGNPEIDDTSAFADGASDNVRTVRYDGGKYRVFSAETDVKKAKVIYAVKNRNFMRDISLMNLYIYLAYAVIVFAGLSIVILTLRRIYRPVNEILETVGEYDTLSRDEFSYITSYIKSAKSEKELLVKISEEQMKTINEQRLADFLSGNTTAEESEIIKTYGLCENSRCFNIICFTLPKENITEYRGNYNETIEGIKRELDDGLKKIGCGFFGFDRGNSTAMLVSSVKIVQSELKSLLRRVCDSIKDRYGFLPLIILSRYCDDIYDIPVEYKKAMSLIKSANIGEGVVLMESKMFDDLNERYSFSVDYKTRLEKFLKQGMADEACELVEKIFQKSFGREGEYNVRLAEFFIFQITSILVKFIEKSENDDLKINAVNVINMIYDDKTVGEMKQTIIEYIHILCDGVQRTGSEKKDELISDIMDIVRKEYGNHSLNVSMIADELHMYQNYISTVFKKQVGKGLLEYINEYRMEKAAQLLLETDMTVDAIADAVGCNTRTFYRNFIKVYGVTATNYRKNGGNV